MTDYDEDFRAAIRRITTQSVAEMRTSLGATRDLANFRFAGPAAINYLVQADNAGRVATIPIERNPVTTPVATPPVAGTYVGAIYSPPVSTNRYEVTAYNAASDRYTIRHMTTAEVFPDYYTASDMRRHENAGLLTWPNGAPTPVPVEPDPNEPARAVWCSACGGHTGQLLPESQHPRNPRCAGCTDLPDIRWMNEDLAPDDEPEDIDEDAEAPEYTGLMCSCGSTDFSMDRDYHAQVMQASSTADEGTCLHFDEPTAEPSYTDTAVYCTCCGSELDDVCVHFN